MFIEGGLSEIPTDLPGISVSRGGSFIGTTQAPSPSSAILTISLDAYLDSQRISYGSPAEFDMPRISSPDDTFPVFSPPPFDVISNRSLSLFWFSELSDFYQDRDRDSRVIDQNMLVPPEPNGGGSSSGGSNGSMKKRGRRHRRLSSLNTVSWPNPNELTVSPRPRRMSTVASSDAGAQDQDADDVISSLSLVLSSLLTGSHTGRRQILRVTSRKVAETPKKIQLQHFHCT